MVKYKKYWLLWLVTIYFLTTVLMPIPAFADVQEQILSYLDVKYFTKQACFAVTENLDFSAVNNHLNSLGYNVDWESDKPDSIKIDGGTGIVSRRDSDVKVTVTATVNTSPEVVKEFYFTVKKLESNIAFSDNFYHPEEFGKALENTHLCDYGWSTSGNAPQSAFEAAVTEDAIFRIRKNGVTDTSPGVLIPMDDKQIAMNFKSDISLSANVQDPGESANRSLFFHVYGKTESGEVKKILESRIIDAGNEISVMGTKEDNVLSTLYTKSHTKGLKFNFEIQVNCDEGQYCLILDGKRIPDENIFFQKPDDDPVKTLSYISINVYKTAVDFEAALHQTSLIYPTPELMFEAPVFKQVINSTETIIQQPESGTIKTEIKVRNFSDSTKKVTLILATYSGNIERLEKVDLCEREVESGEDVTLSAYIDKDTDESFKCFLFNGENSLEPLSVPAASPLSLATELKYDENGCAYTNLTWKKSYAPQNNLAGYNVIRDGRIIAFVDAQSNSYKDYDGDFFSEREYEVRSATTKGISPSGTVIKTASLNTVKLPATTAIDSTTNREYKYITFFGKNAIRDYYTTRNWATDSKRFYFTDDDYRIFEYNIETEMLKFIDQRVVYQSHPARDLMTVGKSTNSLYYVDSNNDVVCMNLNTYEKRKIADIPENIAYTTFISVNDSETKLVLSWKETGSTAKTGRIPVLDLKTGEWDTSFYHDFSQEDPEATTGMPIINPVYENLVLFMKVNSNKERLWLLDKNDDSYKNLYTERLLTESQPAEVMNHENWTMDGNEVIITKYVGGMIGPCGIVGIGLDGKLRAINEETDATHLSTSPASSRWIVADTSNSSGRTNITLVDGVTGEEYKIANVKWTGPHPGHPHPSFSYDGNYVWFAFDSDDEDKVIQIGWADVSDLVNQEAVGGRFELPSKNCDITSYENSSNYVEKVTENGTSAFKIPWGNMMLVNVNDTYKYGGVTPDGGIKINADIEITYLDCGTGRFLASYYLWNETSEYIDKTQRKIEIVDLEDSNEWKTKVISVEGLNLENIELLENDIRIRAILGDVVISNVDVKIAN